jgi:hypothetical protein
MLEYMPSPVHGLDNLEPHFTWSNPTPSAARQAAFRVNITGGWASDDDGAEKTVWSSGVVEGANPSLAVAAKLPLKSDSQYHWTVETFGAAQPALAAVSQPAEFTTGLLAQSDWGSATWIDAGPCPEAPGTWTPGAHWLPTASCQGGLLRKDFTVSQQAARVTVFVSGCHYYELYLDGRRLGAEAAGITNSWTRFNIHRSYATLEIDPKLLAPGPHAFGLHVGQVGYSSRNNDCDYVCALPLCSCCCCACRV